VAEASIKIIFCYLLIVAASVSNVNSQIVFERCPNPNFHKCRWVGDRARVGWKPTKASPIRENRHSGKSAAGAIESSIRSAVQEDRDRRSSDFNYLDRTRGQSTETATRKPTILALQSG
jgi:hypothetical protein